MDPFKPMPEVIRLEDDKFRGYPQFPQLQGGKKGEYQFLHDNKSQGITICNIERKILSIYNMYGLI